MAEGIDALIKSDLLIADIRERTDYILGKGADPEAGFLKDSWIKREIRRAVLRLWDFLYHVYGADFWHTSTTLTTTAGTREVSLPADFWRLKRISYQPTGAVDDVPLSRINMETERLRSISIPWGYGLDIGYYLNIKPQGMANQYSLTDVSKIGFDPIPDAAYTLNLNYVPAPAEIDVDGVGRFWNLFGCEEFVILSVCIKIKQKDEGDPSVFMQALAQERQDIQDNAPPADVAQAETIRDVRGSRENVHDFLWR